jgi:hypothetical protein
MSNKRLVTAAVLVLLGWLSGPAFAQDALTLAGAGLFQGPSVFQNNALTSLRFGVGGEVRAGGAASGDLELTLLGRNAGSVELTVSGPLSAGNVSASGVVTVSATTTVLANGNPFLSDQHVDLKVVSNTDGQGTVEITIEGTTFTAAVVTEGSVTSSSCIAPEYGPSLHFVNQTTLSWAATPYTQLLYRGTFGAGPWTSNHVCFPGTADATIPPVAQGLYYLVSARSACGEGSHGLTSLGNEIPNLSPCP